eukprot:scaffold360_cov374-Pavlova_lutheri.AAC.58
MSASNERSKQASSLASPTSALALESWTVFSLRCETIHMRGRRLIPASRSMGTCSTKTAVPSSPSSVSLASTSSLWIHLSSKVAYASTGRARYSCGLPVAFQSTSSRLAFPLALARARFRWLVPFLSTCVSPRGSLAMARLMAEAAFSRARQGVPPPPSYNARAPHVRGAARPLPAIPALRFGGNRARCGLGIVHGSKPRLPSMPMSPRPCPPPPPRPTPSLPLCLCPSVRLCLSLPASVPLSLCASVCLSLPASVPLSLCASVPLPPCLCPSASVPLPPCLCPSVPLPLCLSLPASVPLSLCLCASPSLPLSLCASVPLPPCLEASPCLSHTLPHSPSIPPCLSHTLPQSPSIPPCLSLPHSPTLSLPHYVSPSIPPTLSLPRSVRLHSHPDDPTRPFPGMPPHPPRGHPDPPPVPTSLRGSPIPNPPVIRTPLSVLPRGRGFGCPPRGTLAARRLFHRHHSRLFRHTRQRSCVHERGSTCPRIDRRDEAGARIPHVADPRWGGSVRGLAKGDGQGTSRHAHQRVPSPAIGRVPRGRRRRKQNDAGGRVVGGSKDAGLHPHHVLARR